MNYQIITNEEKLRAFIDWLPELNPTEKYYLCLFARSKYTKDENGVNQMPHIKSDKAQLRRFVSDKKHLLHKIRQLECPLGAYVQYNNVEHPIPQSALALYINPNPRDLWKATVNSGIKLIECIRNRNEFVNPAAECMSEIQKQRGDRHFVMFDLDAGDLTPEQVHTYLWNKVNLDAVTLLKTRGGYHILVEPGKVQPALRNSWYRDIAGGEHIDQVGDQMIPVPGTYQGGFTPHFINL